MEQVRKRVVCYHLVKNLMIVISQFEKVLNLNRMKTFCLVVKETYFEN
jgi:hypothetical protein